TLVDLDIVNPYFRSREQRQMLSAAGVNVLASVEDYFDTDLPALSPAITGALKDANGAVVLDVGGDETGARALGRFYNLLAHSKYNLFFVVNPFRPFAREPSGISKVLRGVEQTSRLKVSALISNPNLGRETCPEDIVTGHRTVMDASRQLDLPVAFLCIPETISMTPEIEGVAESVFPVKLFMLPPWFI
ncbi:MAG: hypothetical protein ACOY4Q_10670, partial [Bacillota bacterium]